MSAELNSEAEQIKALAVGIDRNRLLPLVSNLLLVSVFALMTLLSTLTNAINTTDIMIFIVMLAMYLCAIFIFNIRGRNNSYRHFQIIISLTLLSVFLLLFNALLGGHGTEIYDGSLPWIIPFIPVVTIYIYTFQIERHARVFTGIFIALNILGILFYLWQAYPGFEIDPIATIWIFGIVTAAVFHMSVLARMQVDVQGQVIRELLDAQARMRKAIEEQNIAMHTDQDTGVFNLSGVLARLNEDRKEGQRILGIVIPRHQALRQSLGDAGFKAYSHEVAVILSNLRGEGVVAGRPLENVFLAWTPSWTDEQLEGQIKFVNLMMRPVWVEQEEIRPIVFSTHLGKDFRQIDRDGLLTLVNEAAEAAQKHG